MQGIQHIIIEGCCIKLTEALSLEHRMNFVSCGKHSTLKLLTLFLHPLDGVV